MIRSGTTQGGNGIDGSERERLAQILRRKASVSRAEHAISPGQGALLFLHRMAPQSPAYNVAFVARVTSPVQISALGRALQRLVDRHATLRTTYSEKQGSWYQIVHGSMELKLEEVDASSWSEVELQDQVRRAFSAPYDLERGPIIRAMLFSRTPSDHVLLFGMHHIATDGWSQGIILHELRELYAAYSQKRAAQLPTLGLSYAESVRWQEAALRSEKGEQLWAYWHDVLSGELPSLDLPADHPRPTVPSMQGDSCPFRIDEVCYAQLKSLAATEGVTLFTLILAAFQILLMAYSGKEDILVGTPMAGRGEPEFQSVVGYFVNSVVIRGDLSGEPTFREFVQRFRHVVLGALSHQEYPFSHLVKRLCPEREASRSPIFQVMFNLQSRHTLGPFADLLAGDDSGGPVDFAGLRLKPFQLAQGAGAFDLILELIDSGSRLHGAFMYSTDLFDKDTVERMGGHFNALLQSIARSPDDRITRLQVLSDSERQELVQRWNATDRSYPSDKCVHELIRAQAKTNPGAVAVACEHKRLTYRDLVARAQVLSAHLQGLGIGEGRLVGIIMERSTDMVVALFGVLMSGAAYVPMDPAFPSERLAVMLEDAACAAILTQRCLARVLPITSAIVVDLDTIDFTGRPAMPWSEVRPATPDSLAYVIYTSGSTGKPKGVQITHRALVNFLVSMQREPGISASDNLLSVTTISFDIFGLEVYLPLISGACTTIATREVASDGTRLRRAIERSKATIMQATPATWRLLLEAGWHSARRLKALCGGEALTRDLADRILDTGAELWNMYGPTETTIWSATEKISSGTDPISIGRPIANTQLHVLNRFMQLSPIGVPGELYIGGDGLAKGYHNREELARRSFVQDPFSSRSGARLYRTGDIVRRGRDGSIQFLGRIDNQVKLRGFRIELGEIEYHLDQHPAVKNSVVTVREDAPTGKRLVAYYVPYSEIRPTARGFRKYLTERLPDYMIPAVYVCLPEFPLTPNAKIDRRALPKPDLGGEGARAEYVAPRDATERFLAGVWRDVLGVERVSIWDNFFVLGGDSLLAARLFAEIEKKTKRNIPLATLFQRPTVAELAEVVRAPDTDLSWSPLVTIQAEGNSPPLFLVHGAEGNVLLYRSLQHHLGDQQRVYGLQSEGLDGRKHFDPTIESMASSYIRAIRSIQPQGPYYLGGYCMGGTIAFEMAQQFRAAGESVALLALFETYNLGAARISARFIVRVINVVENILFHLLNALSLRARGRISFLTDKLHTESTRLKIRRDIFVQRLRAGVNGNDRSSYHYLKVKKANDRANERYRARRYDGRLILFRPLRGFTGYGDRWFGWKGIAGGGIEIHVLPFYPRGMLAEPFVEVLAERLKASMDGRSNFEKVQSPDVQHSRRV
jgi:amino acid adenylation domain-containing protein